MAPDPLHPPNFEKSWHGLVRLAERIAELQSETAEIVAETREAIRRSHEVIDGIQAAADRQAGPAPP